MHDCIPRWCRRRNKPVGASFDAALDVSQADTATIVATTTTTANTDIAMMTIFLFTATAVGATLRLEVGPMSVSAPLCSQHIGVQCMNQFD